jgi:hypothetical protein
MRNLLGRLNARSPEELRRIAVAWRVPVTGGDKLGQVAFLYRSLSDPRAARDLWEELPPDERELIALLSDADDSALPLTSIADQLGKSEPEVRETATRLYHKGIVVREGDIEPLPVGEPAKLFLPRELALLFRRIRDEISAGDLSGESLRSLLARLDDREIEETAEHWGIHVVPGLRRREELIGLILTNAGDRKRLDEIEARLNRDSARIWQRVRQVDPGKLVPYSEVAGLPEFGLDDARQPQRLRQALAELEERLLVWHSYTADGSRWLFSPVELGVPADAEPASNRLPVPVASTAPVVAKSSSFAVAWDLLTLLRALSPPIELKISDIAGAPAGWLRRLNESLWNRGRDAPPVGYLEFLIDLARVEGILSGGDPAVEEPFHVSSEVRTWRDRSFTEQTRRLRETWLASSVWIEGSERDDIEVYGADWPGFRHKLRAAMAGLEPETWYELEPFAQALAARDPNMLGATSEVVTAHNLETGGDESVTRRAEIAEVISIALTTAFSWFGLVETARSGRDPLLLRLTAVGAALARDAADEEPPTRPGPALTLDASGEIQVLQPTPLRVWSLSAFSDQIELGEPSRYRLTESSVGRALRAGFEAKHIRSFLANQTGATLPAELETRISAWSQSVKRVRLKRIVRLTPDTPAQLAEIERALVDLGLTCSSANGSLEVELDRGSELSRGEHLMLTALREAGFTPQGIEEPSSNRGTAKQRSFDPRGVSR